MSSLDYATQVPVETAPDAGAVDKRYLKGIPGIIKFLEMGLSLVALICGAVSSPGGFAVRGYFIFATTGAFVIAILMWLLLLLKLHRRICRCDCVNWPFFEFMVYAITIVFYFFAVLFMSIFADGAASKAACVFGWFGFGAFIADFVFALRVWLQSRKESRQSTTTTAEPSAEPRY